jgi:hypothetical protein
MKNLTIMLLFLPVLLLPETPPQEVRELLATCSDYNPFTKGDSTATDKALQQYAGIYKLNEQFAITVSVENNKVYGLAPGDAEKTEFTPVSEHKFIIRGPEAEVEFVKENGKIKYMLVQMQGGLKLTKEE